MKFFLILSLCAVAAAAHSVIGVIDSMQEQEGMLNNDINTNSILIDILVRNLFAYIRNVIKNGSNLLGIPVLDPLRLDHYHLQLPAGLINLNLLLKNAEMTGAYDFVVHKGDLNLKDLTFDIDISVPELIINCELYDLDGDLFNAIPIYGLGKARFELKDFRFQMKLHLAQSNDGHSVIIREIEGLAFQIPHLKSHIDGAIGGGDIDHIVNAIVEDVLIGYVNRFQGAISKIVAPAIVFVGNPYLEKVPTWVFIAPFL